MVTKYHGKNSQVYMSPTGTGTPVLVGGFRELTLDMTQDQVDTTEFGATNRTSVIGFPAIRGTFAGFWASDDATLQQASKSADGTIIYIYPSSTYPSKYAGGPAWVDMSLRSAIDAAVGTTANFAARGNWVNNL